MLNICQVGTYVQVRHVSGIMDQDEPSLITGVIGCLVPGLTVNDVPNCCLVDCPLLKDKEESHYS